MPVILQKNGYPVKHAGDVTLKVTPRRELYVFSSFAAWVLSKHRNVFLSEFRRGVYNGVQIRRHSIGWVFNLHDIIKFAFPFINEEKIAEIMMKKLDEYVKIYPKFKKLYLE